MSVNARLYVFVYISSWHLFIPRLAENLKVFNNPCRRLFSKIREGHMYAIGNLRLGEKQ